MSITTISSASGLRTLEELNSRKPAYELDRNAFLSLLVAQLANQNPLEPAGDTEFITQLAQFSALEQMQSLNANAITSQAYSLIGKYAYVKQDSKDENLLIFGRVDGIIKQDGIDYVIIAGEKYGISDVTGVIDAVAAEGSSDEQVLQSSGLIGRNITATICVDGTELTVTGTVSKIVIRAGVIYALVDGREIPLKNITEIQNNII